MHKPVEHTPGPWEVKPEEPERDYIRVRGTVLGGQYKIANVTIPLYPETPSSFAEEARANARLIAAAPELLEACKYVASVLGDDYPQLTLKKRLQGAIDTATGKGRNPNENENVNNPEESKDAAQG